AAGDRAGVASGVAYRFAVDGAAAVAGAGSGARAASGAAAVAAAGERAPGVDGAADGGTVVDAAAGKLCQRRRGGSEAAAHLRLHARDQRTADPAARSDVTRAGHFARRRAVVARRVGGAAARG